MRIDNEQHLQEILNGNKLKSVVTLDSGVVTISFGEWGKFNQHDYSSVFVNVDVSIKVVGDLVELMINSVESVNLSVRASGTQREKIISMANEYNVGCFHIHDNGMERERIVECRKLLFDLMTNNLDEEVFSVMAHEKKYDILYNLKMAEKITYQREDCVSVEDVELSDNRYDVIACHYINKENKYATAIYRFECEGDLKVRVI